MTRRQNSSSTLNSSRLRCQPEFNSSNFSCTGLSNSFFRNSRRSITCTRSTTRRNRRACCPRYHLRSNSSLIRLSIIRMSIPRPSNAIIVENYLVIIISTNAVILLGLLIVFLNLRILSNRLRASYVVTLNVSNLCNKMNSRNFNVITQFVVLMSSCRLRIRITSLCILTRRQAMIFTRFLNLTSTRRRVLTLILRVSFISRSSNGRLHLISFKVYEDRARRQLTYRVVVTVVSIRIVLFRSSARVVRMLTMNLITSRSIPIIRHSTSTFLRSLMDLKNFTQRCSRKINGRSNTLLRLNVGRSITDTRRRCRRRSSPNGNGSHRQDTRLITLQHTPCFFSWFSRIPDSGLFRMIFQCRVVISIIFSTSSRSILSVSGLVNLINCATFINCRCSNRSLFLIRFLRRIRRFRTHFKIRNSNELVNGSSFKFNSRNANSNCALLLSSQRLIEVVINPLLRTRFFRVFRHRFITLLTTRTLMRR